MITKEKKDGMLQQSKSDKPIVKKNFIFMAVSDYYRFCSYGRTGKFGRKWF